jgi:uncharacterized protein (DUF433 family)
MILVAPLRRRYKSCVTRPRSPQASTSPSSAATAPSAGATGGALSGSRSLPLPLDLGLGPAATNPRPSPSPSAAPGLLPPVRVAHPHVVVAPTMLSGSPTIAGTRVPVRRLWAWHKGGTSVETLMRRYPQLGPARVLDALAFAYDNEELVEADVAREAALLDRTLTPTQRTEARAVAGSPERPRGQQVFPFVAAPPSSPPAPETKGAEETKAMPATRGPSVGVGVGVGSVDGDAPEQRVARNAPAGREIVPPASRSHPPTSTTPSTPTPGPKSTEDTTPAGAPGRGRRR